MKIKIEFDYNEQHLIREVMKSPITTSTEFTTEVDDAKVKVKFPVGEDGKHILVEITQAGQTIEFCETAKDFGIDLNPPIAAKG